MTRVTEIQEPHAFNQLGNLIVIFEINEFFYKHPVVVVCKRL